MDFMTKLGYLNVRTIVAPQDWANDYIFVHPSIAHLLSNVRD
jgi:hypothetical protein